MSAPSGKTVILTIVAYMVATFGVQGMSHFVIAAEHYRAVSFLRAQPNFALGLLSMLIQGALFAWLYPRFYRGGSPLKAALILSWALGGFLASYLAFAEPGKYAVPSTASWMVVETGSAVAQYTLFGLILGMIHGGRTAPAPA